MALIKDYQTKSGLAVTGAYHIIDTIIYSAKSGIADIQVAIYANQAAYVAGRDPVALAQYSITSPDQTTLSGALGAAQTYLLGLPDYSGATVA